MCFIVLSVLIGIVLNYLALFDTNGKEIQNVQVVSQACQLFVNNVSAIYIPMDLTLSNNSFEIMNVAPENCNWALINQDPIEYQDLTEVTLRITSSSTKLQVTPSDDSVKCDADGTCVIPKLKSVLYTVVQALPQQHWCFAQYLQGPSLLVHTADFNDPNFACPVN